MLEIKLKDELKTFSLIEIGESYYVLKNINSYKDLSECLIRWLAENNDLDEEDYIEEQEEHLFKYWQNLNKHMLEDSNQMSQGQLDRVQNLMNGMNSESSFNPSFTFLNFLDGEKSENELNIISNYNDYLKGGANQKIDHHDQKNSDQFTSRYGIKIQNEIGKFNDYCMRGLSSMKSDSKIYASIRNAVRRNIGSQKVMYSNQQLGSGAHYAGMSPTMSKSRNRFSFENDEDKVQKETDQLESDDKSLKKISKIKTSQKLENIEEENNASKENQKKCLPYIPISYFQSFQSFEDEFAREDSPFTPCTTGNKSPKKFKEFQFNSNDESNKIIETGYFVFINYFQIMMMIHR